MRAKDLMTTNLVTVTLDTRLADIAHLLAHRRISAVPVVTPEGGLLGIVTEADPVRRLTGAAPGTGWFAGLIGRRPGDTADDYARLHGTRAEDLCSASPSRRRRSRLRTPATRASAAAWRRRCGSSPGRMPISSFPRCRTAS